MVFTEDQTDKIPVQLPNGKKVLVEVAQVGPEEVAFDAQPFTEVTEALEGIVEALAIPLQKTMPDKASVKFGLELAVEAGQLTAAIVKGSGKANLEITLEWNKTLNQ